MISRSKSYIRCVLVLLAVSAFSSNVYAAYDTEKNVEVYDPLESVNRAVYGFNRFMDKILLKPVAEGYRKVVPALGRKGVRNVLNNLTEPVTFINSVLQLDRDRAFTSFWRFTLNTTFGLGGLNDFAGNTGLKLRKEDFGQTMGTYKVGAGPYIMLPLFGPSNTRDAFGTVVDIASDPFTYTFNEYINAGRTIVKGIDTREDTLDLTKEIDRISLDPYASIRSLYTQKRKDEIKNGK